MPGPAPGPGGRQGGAGEDPGAGGQHEGQAGGRQGARHPGCRHQVGWRTVLHCILVLLILISLFRIQQLTASLMSKQSILERVTSERTSLAYRLERLEVRTGGHLHSNQISSYHLPQKQVSEVPSAGRRSRRGEEAQGQDTAYMEVS